MMLGLRTTIYKVDDLAAAKKWYAEIFDTKPYFDQPFYVGFNIGGYELGLLPSEVKAEEKKGGVLSYWGVENVHEVYSNLLEKGATPNVEPSDVGDDIITASVIDPWGNILGIIYNPHFKLD